MRPENGGKFPFTRYGGTSFSPGHEGIRKSQFRDPLLIMGYTGRFISFLVTKIRPKFYGMCKIPNCLQYFLVTTGRDRRGRAGLIEEGNPFPALLSKAPV